MTTKYKLPKIEELFDSGVHIGHQARRWFPKMEKYIFSAENNIHVFDLEQTHNLLKTAAEFLYEIAKKGGQVIFVGTKRQASEPIKTAAIASGALFVAERWLGGTITNFKMIKRNMDKYVSLTKKREEGALSKYTKKERLLIDREIEKLEKYVGGIVNLKGVPAAVVVVDPRKEKTVVREALRYKVPVIALIDSNSDPTKITYPIPGNDDAIKSISVILDTLAGAIKEGYDDLAKLGEEAVAKAKLEAEKAALEAVKIAEEAAKAAQALAVEVAAKIADEVVVAPAVGVVEEVAAVKKKPVKKAKK